MKFRSPELDVQTWKMEYFEPGDTQCPPPVIPFDDIRGQLCRASINSSEPVMWITISLDKVRLAMTKMHVMIDICSQNAAYDDDM
jgi:hypothetical protein